MKEKLDSLKVDFSSLLTKIEDNNSLEELQKDFLWKKWYLNDILKWIKDLSPEDKKVVGPEANRLKNFILDEIEKKELELEEKKYANIEKEEEIDVTLEFPLNNIWHKHPISITSKLLEDIFISLWFRIEDGPQIETEEYNFDKLNIPSDHPARDVWDTFWVSDEINKGRPEWDKYLLRTHTSPVQIRTMMSQELPIKIVVPGRVFRYEQVCLASSCSYLNTLPGTNKDSGPW